MYLKIFYKCSVNDKGRKLTWDGRYAVVGRVKPKDLITLSLPIKERSLNCAFLGMV